MILHLDKNTPNKIINSYVENTSSFVNVKQEYIQLVNSSVNKNFPKELSPFVLQEFVFENDIQLASIQYKTYREIPIKHISIGRNSPSLPLIMGPCSVESTEQINQVAQFLTTNRLSCIRAGAFKPRTSPYSFQGLEKKGLDILQETAKTNQLITFSEAKNAEHINQVINQADVVQIGTKSMYDQALLKALGKTNKPVLLKRGFSSTLQEFIQAAEFILCGGNENVILCERGIRTFEPKTRFTLDLCSVAWIKEHINLPIVIDPSHALGKRYGIIDLSKAAVAMGADGLLIEVHPDPNSALSDADQQIDFKVAKALINEILPLVELNNKKLC